MSKWIDFNVEKPEVDEQVWVHYHWKYNEDDIKRGMGFAIWTGEDWIFDVLDDGDLLSRQQALKNPDYEFVAEITHWCKMPSFIDF